MYTECSICLEPYRDASSIPCGHIFCFPCLQGHISKTSTDGLNAACPTCDVEFAFATPDATLVMEPLRKHMHPAIRKVFVDVDTTRVEMMAAELKDAEKRVMELEKKLKSTETKLWDSEEKLKVAEEKSKDHTPRLNLGVKRPRMASSDDLHNVSWTKSPTFFKIKPGIPRLPKSK